MKLTEKLLKVMQECAHIGKDAVNEEVGYPYVSAAKINEAVNRSLTNNGIATTARSHVTNVLEVGGKIFAAVEVAITLHDTESDETLRICGAGSGIDASDKAIAKAQTMAVKYAWKDTLLICDASDDPDAVGGKINYVSKPQAARNAGVANNGSNGIKVPF